MPSSIGTAGKNAKETIVISRKCPHVNKDGAIEVAKYIVEEIKRNVKSIEAQRIRYYLTGEIGDKLQKSFDEIDKSVNEIINTTGYTPHYKRPKTPSFTTALSLFCKQVNTDQPWDHKPKIRKKFKQVAVKRPLPSGKPSETWYHKYKDYDYYLDVWSNIHYGYVGRSIGFTEKELLQGSDLQQRIKENKKTLWEKRRFTSRGDSIDDITTMKMGFKLFNNFGKNAENLTYKNILNNISDTKLPVSRQKHWCYDNKNPNRIKVT